MKRKYKGRSITYWKGMRLETGIDKALYTENIVNEGMVSFDMRKVSTPLNPGMGLPLGKTTSKSWVAQVFP